MWARSRTEDAPTSSASLFLLSSLEEWWVTFGSQSRAFFLTNLQYQGVIAYFAFQFGDPWRIINGYDSFGNTCGANNTKIDGLDADLNGLDLTDYP